MATLEQMMPRSCTRISKVNYNSLNFSNEIERLWREENISEWELNPRPSVHLSDALNTGLMGTRVVSIEFLSFFFLLRYR